MGSIRAAHSAPGHQMLAYCPHLRVLAIFSLPPKAQFLAPEPSTLLPVLNASRLLLRPRLSLAPFHPLPDLFPVGPFPVELAAALAPPERRLLVQM